MNEKQPEGVAIFSERPLPNEADKRQPCPTCGSSSFWIAEVEATTYRRSHGIPDQVMAIALAQHLREQPNAPEWLNAATMADNTQPDEEYIRMEGPLSCRHEGMITKDSTIAGYEHTVYVDGQRLSPKRSQQLVNHSPDGFSWGYGGSGPAQLALALLLEAGASDEEAIWHYQAFKWQIVSTLPDQSKFLIPGSTVTNWLNAIRNV